MTISKEDAIKILKAGGGIIIDGMRFTPEDLYEMASAASIGGVLLLAENADKMSLADVKKLLSKGCGAAVDRKHHSQEELCQLAASAKKGGTILLIHGVKTHFSTEKAIEVSSSGKGSVLFDYWGL